jgi:hypothetical protein
MNIFGIEIPVVVVALLATFVPMFFFMVIPTIRNAKKWKEVNDHVDALSRADAERRNAIREFKSRRVGEYEFIPGKRFTVSITTSWHLRHEYTPYYAVAQGVGGVVATGTLVSDLDDIAVSIHQLRWNLMLAGYCSYEQSYQIL